MLHILLFILKIIGIILAVILGILVLLIGIILFVPVRYEILGSCGGDLDSLQAKVRITWFLHLIHADAMYKKKRLRWRVRAAWIWKGNVGRRTEENTEISGEESKGNQIKKKQTEKEQGAEKEIRIKEEQVKESKEEKKEEKKIEETSEEYGTVSGECEEGREEPDSSVEEQQEETESVEEIPEEEPETPEISEVGEESEDTAEKGTGLYEKIQKILQKIKCTFQSFCDKIKALLEKKEKLTNLIQDEVHVAAFQKVKKEAFCLLRRLSPKKLEARLVYGFEDPCLTGQVLAGFSMLYPFIGEHVNITPDFERRILQGRCCIKGKLYAWHFAQVCWNLIWCKNVRETYRHIKNFKM